MMVSVRRRNKLSLIHLSISSIQHAYGIHRWESLTAETPGELLQVRTPYEIGWTASCSFETQMGVHLIGLF